ncbi:tetratricopeptide repeat protein [Kutzneria viridogrisea]
MPRVRNDVSGTVNGPVLQARDFHGPVTVTTQSAHPGMASVTAPVGRLEHGTRGRAALIERLTGAVLSPAGRVVVLHAGGGYGKTTVALRVAEQVADQVRVWWVDATTTASLTAGLAEVALQAGAPPASVREAWTGTRSAPELLWRTLNEVPNRWLLVLDNADDTRVLAAQGQQTADYTGWLRGPRQGSGTVLVTTRDQDQAAWGSVADRYPVPALDPVDGAEVLLELAPTAGSREEATELSHRLGGLPLALRLAGAYLASTSGAPALPGLAQPRGFAGYQAAFEQRSVELTDVGTPREREQLSRTWELSLDLLAERGLPQARPLLRLLSCLAAAPVPHFLLDAAVLARSPLFPELTPQRLAGLLSALTNLGLVHGVDTAVLHPVVRDMTRQQRDVLDEHAGYAELHLRLIEAGTADREPVEPANWSCWAALLPHCLTLAENEFPVAADQALLAVVQHRAADFADAIGHAQDAYALYQRALAVLSRTQGPEAATTLTVRHNLAAVLRDRGDLASAEAAFREIHGVQQRVLGPEHPNTLTTRQNLAGVLRDRGDLSGAEDELRAVHAVRLRVQGADHPSTLIARNNLAMVVWDRGDLASAEIEFGAVLAVQQRVVGPEHPNTLSVRHNLACIVRDRGDVRAAEVELREVLAVRARVLGAEHPETLSTRNNLAWLWWIRHDLASAEEAFREVHAARSRVLGPEHPSTLNTRHALEQVAAARRLDVRPER